MAARMTRRHLRQLAVALAGVAAAGALGAYLVIPAAHRPGAHSPPGSHRSPGAYLSSRSGAGRRQACVRVPPARSVGVAVTAPVSRNAREFATATGAHPRMIVVYDGFGSPFQVNQAEQMARLGALPVIQWNPRHVSLAAIAAGRWDAYLRRYAAAVAKFGCPLVLSFAHEMNGSWYPWGCRHTGAAVYKAAWRRIVGVMTQAGARNVIWMWTTNAEAPGDCPVASRYPGGRYVTWIGVDGYPRIPGRTFQGIFGSTLAGIRRFSAKPILLAETGVLVNTPGAAARIRGLFAGAAATPGMIGVVYFDARTRKYGDYRPQDNPAVLAAFRQAVARYTAGR
jgi:mannan endo-1,4-beta-mannosidase